MLAKEGEDECELFTDEETGRYGKALDSTRPVTAGCNEPNPNNHLFRSGALDLIGFNYHDDWFAGVPEKFPGKPFIVAESVSALMTRGYYRMPSDETVICPERWINLILMIVSPVLRMITVMYLGGTVMRARCAT